MTEGREPIAPTVRDSPPPYSLPSGRNGLERRGVGVQLAEHRENTANMKVEGGTVSRMKYSETFSLLSIPWLTYSLF